MFCSKEVSHILDCECHTLQLSTIFTTESLYSIYLVLRVYTGGADIFSAFIARLHQINITPTHVYLCTLHKSIRVTTKPTMDSFCNVRTCGAYNVYCMGCVNQPIFPPSWYKTFNISRYISRYNLDILTANCYDGHGKRIECPKIAAYFPKK